MNGSNGAISFQTEGELKLNRKPSARMTWKRERRRKTEGGKEGCKEGGKRKRAVPGRTPKRRKVNEQMRRTVSALKETRHSILRSEVTVRKCWSKTKTLTSPGSN